jgi:hypothetical protein
VAARRTKTAGQRLIDELSQPDDPYTLQMLIGRAAQTADWLDKLADLINGKRAAWMHVRVNRDQVLEVRIDGAMRESRQLTTELRHLLAEIHRQRASIPMGPDDDDDLAGID